MIAGTYRYPDSDDRLTSSFVREHEPYPGYWAASEQRALELLAERLSAELGRRSRVRALDAGCGDGRLLPWIARFAATITAADPDAGRLERARTVALPGGTDVSFQATPITEVRGGPFDLLVCSHVIQHVPTSALVPSLRRLHDVAAPGGQLVLSFSRAPVGQGGFSLDSLVDGTVQSRPVGRDQFDHALTDGWTPEILPVRHIDPEMLAAEAARAGWTGTWAWTYHVLEDLSGTDEGVDRDELVNSTTSMRRTHGRDIMTLWRRDGTNPSA
ncbi:class I SAM-dependent methyltransferase [Qaidamihabitans albus]|uniref:class I SAM-dependent methyltransferase n=1 Tax=Qaidamihabitans albus TaxID=2795733 RepID=UPI0018F25A92|nr:class I SAM-dependent methyltransferase [Qaidamihabitans albus]